MLMFNKGNDKKQGGVGFLIHKKLKGNIEEFHATSNRVASVTIRISKRYKIRIIQVYAPTSVSSQEELEEFYDDLQTEMRHKKTHYNVIIIIIIIIMVIFKCYFSGELIALS